MSVKSLLSRAFLGSATLLGACTWDISTPSTPLMQPAPAHEPVAAAPAAPREISILCNPDTTQVVVWGDSIANGIGQALPSAIHSEMNRHCETPHRIKTVNLGVDSAGLHASVPTVSTATLLANATPGSIVIINVGTNDVGYMDNNPRKIHNYAATILSLAENIRDRRATPVIVGMQAPVSDYGLIKGEYRHQWIETMTLLNTALKDSAEKSGIDFIANNVPDRHDDGLHYTPEGSKNIISLAVTRTLSPS